MTDSLISPELQELIRARIDERPFVPPVLRLICNKCNGRYPVGPEPVALGFGPNGATVYAGWLEVCPHCFHGHIGGDVLAVEMVEVVNALQPL
ncbi:MAG: hypothetical protein IAE79_17930 [Anaerolinea sp.]|nr:hypothetical protein [Anaerolinea sp.]